MNSLLIITVSIIIFIILCPVLIKTINIHIVRSILFRVGFVILSLMPISLRVKLSKTNLTFVGNTMKSTLIKCLYLNKTYEESVLNYIHHTINKGDVVIDVGANEGIISLYSASLGAKVYAVEASPNNVKLMNKNIEENKLNSSIQVFNVAGGDKNSKIKLNESIFNGMWNVVGDEHRALPSMFYKPSVISVVKIDDIIPENIYPLIKVVKIDVEGFEDKVLNGMNKILTTNRNIIWIIETNNISILEKFESLNYNIKYLPVDSISFPGDINYVEDYRKTNRKIKTENFIFTPLVQV